MMHIVKSLLGIVVIGGINDHWRAVAVGGGVCDVVVVVVAVGRH